MRHPHQKAIAILHSNLADTRFNLVSQIPTPKTGPKLFGWSFPPPAFSGGGSKLAVAANDGTLSVWDIRNKIPLIVKEADLDGLRLGSLQFSSGTLGREVLAFTEVSQLCFGHLFSSC